MRRPRLVVGEHAERGAGLHAERLARRDHLQHGVELRPVAHLAPGGAHAEAGRARCSRAFRAASSTSSTSHQSSRRSTLGVVVRRLRAVAAILRAAAGLDRQEGAELHLALGVPREVDGARLVDEREERLVVEGHHLGDGPVVANGGGLGGSRRQRHTMSVLSPGSAGGASASPRGRRCTRLGTRRCGTPSSSSTTRPS